MSALAWALCLRVSSGVHAGKPLGVVLVEDRLDDLSYYACRTDCTLDPDRAAAARILLLQLEGQSADDDLIADLSALAIAHARADAEVAGRVDFSVRTENLSFQERVTAADLVGWAFDEPLTAGVLDGCEGVELGAVLILVVNDDVGEACQRVLVELAEHGEGAIAAAAYVLVALVLPWRDRLELTPSRELALRAIATAHAARTEAE